MKLESPCGESDVSELHDALEPFDENDHDQCDDHNKGAETADDDFLEEEGKDRVLQFHVVPHHLEQKQQHD